MEASTTIPKSHRALVLRSVRDPLDMAVRERTTPTPAAGAATVRILTSPVLSYGGDVYSGRKKAYNFPENFVPGFSAIGRIAAVGLDAALLKPGQLVFVDNYVRGRDDITARFISGLYDGFTAGSKQLMHGEWRDSTYAEYYKAPLEACHALDENRLLGSPAHGGLGYTLDDLVYIGYALVPFGGLWDVGLKPGEKVVVGPATGPFGSLAVHLSLALGASQVVAMGRNVEALERLKASHREDHGRLKTVRITGDVKAETAALREGGPADVFFDISPPAAVNSSHFQSGILSLGYNGRASLMGGQLEDIQLPVREVMHQCLTLRGKWMYEQGDVRTLIGLIQAGIVRLGPAADLNIVGRFPLERFEEAFDVAAKNASPGRLVVFTS